MEAKKDKRVISACKQLTLTTSADGEPNSFLLAAALAPTQPEERFALSSILAPFELWPVRKENS